MTRFTHSILFFFAIALALLCSAVLMLFLNETWADTGFTLLVSSALVLSLLVPAGFAFASLRYLKWHQPMTAWGIFYLVSLLTIAILGQQLLG